jgi:hypothetical protein
MSVSVVAAPVTIQDEKPQPLVGSSLVVFQWLPLARQLPNSQRFSSPVAAPE